MVKYKSAELLSNQEALKKAPIYVQIGVAAICNDLNSRGVNPIPTLQRFLDEVSEVEEQLENKTKELKKYEGKKHTYLELEVLYDGLKKQVGSESAVQTQTIEQPEKSAEEAEVEEDMEDIFE